MSNKKVYTLSNYIILQSILYEMYILIILQYFNYITAILSWNNKV